MINSKGTVYFNVLQWRDLYGSFQMSNCFCLSSHWKWQCLFESVNTEKWLYWQEPLLKALLSFMESDVCSSQSACHQQLSECYPASLLTSIGVKLLLLLLLLVTFLLFYTIFSFILSQRGDILYQLLHVLIHSKTLVMEFSFGINTWYRFEMLSLW